MGLDQPIFDAVPFLTFEDLCKSILASNDFKRFLLHRYRVQSSRLVLSSISQDTREPFNRLQSPPEHLLRTRKRVFSWSVFHLGPLAVIVQCRSSRRAVPLCRLEDPLISASASHETAHSNIPSTMTTTKDSEKVGSRLMRCTSDGDQWICS